ncbi:gamma-mobile-trio protein GmtX [Dokdonella sp.]|uniref:gamma-mobile-trio protein GmtX n=1 Tax=Dokdonella sp. TaxID=2291710 RepID=UPI003784D715
MTAHETETPDGVLARLRALHADPRRQRSLLVVDEVCRLQREHGSHDFSVKTIGRLSATRNGPGRAAIANPNGAPYRELIDAHQRATVPMRAASGGAQDDEAAILAGVSGPLQRARVRTALADARHWAEEAKRWRRKANALQAIANASATLTLEPGEGAGDLPTARLGRAARIELLATEKAALAAALDGRRLGTIGLRTDARGRVLDAEGRVVFPIGFATMLAKVAVALGVEFGDRTSVTSSTQRRDSLG